MYMLSCRFEVCAPRNSFAFEEGLLLARRTTRSRHVMAWHWSWLCGESITQNAVGRSVRVCMRLLARLSSVPNAQQ